MSSSSSSSASSSPFTKLTSHQIKKILKEEADSNAAIDVQLLEARRVQDRRIQFLILGGRGAGKSSLLNGMRLLHGSDHGAEEVRDCFIPLIRANTIEAAIKVAREVKDRGFEKELTESQKSALKRLLDLNPNESHKFDGILEEMKTLNQSKSFQHVIHDPACSRLPDNALPFLERLEEIASESFVPSPPLICFARARLVGVEDITVNRFNSFMQFIDISGQHNETRKFMHHFDGVTGVVFVADLSSYCAAPLEEEAAGKTLLHEEIEEFKRLFDYQGFHNATFVLALNKFDVFISRLQVLPLQNYFPEYSGNSDPYQAADFIAGLFKKSILSRGSRCYHVFTNFLTAGDINDHNGLKKFDTYLADLCLKKD